MGPHFALAGHVRTLFEQRLLHYLAGVGHPPSTSGVLVTDRDFEESLGDTSLRTRLFLIALTGMDLAPVDGLQKLSVRIFFELDRF